MYAFALRPRWWLSHILVIALIGAMIFAMFWQIDRLGQRRDLNARITARTGLGIEPLEDLVTPNLAADEIDELEYRRVEVTGVFSRDDEVLVRNRSLNGAPGSWVITPLELADGRAVAVNRGWLPASIKADDERAEFDPPVGPITITGYLRLTQIAVGFQVADPAAGHLSSLARPDLARLDAQTNWPLLPVWIQVDTFAGTSASSRGLPSPLELPPLSDGPHRGYAMQWAIFALIGLIGYPMILRRVAATRANERAVAASVEAAESDLQIAASESR